MMKTMLIIFSLVMMIGVIYSTDNAITEHNQSIVYKDSTAYYKGRYDSVVRLQGEFNYYHVGNQERQATILALEKSGEQFFIPGDSNFLPHIMLGYTGISLEVKPCHPVRPARHRKDAAYRINDTAYVSGWCDGYMFRSKEIDKDTITIDLSKTPKWMVNPYFDTTIHH